MVLAPGQILYSWAPAVTYLQLLVGEVLIALVGVVFGKGWVMLGDKGNATVSCWNGPHEGAAHNGVHRLAQLLVHNRKPHSDVPDHTDGHEQEAAGVDGAEEDEGCDGAQDVWEGPRHSGGRFMHLQREEEEEEQVRHREIEKQDVRG